MFSKVIKISFLFFLTLPFSLEAVSLGKSVYNKGSDIEIKDVFNNANRLTVYHFDSLDTKYCQTNKEEVDEMGGLRETCSGDYYSFDIGRYSIIEHSEPGIICNRLNYDNCKSLSSFLNEFIFEVKEAEGGGGWFSPPVQAPVVPGGGGGGGPTAYRPEIGIYSPIDGKTYGSLIEVIYEATDKNDELGQTSLGLPATPVTIFYSPSSDTRQRVQLGSILPSKGIFRWDTKDLPEGDNYNIIISATDKSGETGEAVSGDFGIDHTAPIFTIKADPPVTRGEDVKIIVESTKELAGLPTVRVAQNEFNFFEVVMTGSGKNFEGVYRVVGGYDGPAKINISGTDLSGNTSTLIAGGGQFSVGVEPPPKPIILEPLDREIATTGVINIKGKARKDTEVVMSLNGADKFSTNPDADGFFYFSNIKLKPDFNYGSNIISIIAIDAAHNTSESSDIFLKLNIAPDIFIESPSAGQTLGTSTPISVKATDKNKDKLNFDYEVSLDNGLNWITLAKSVTSSKYTWNTTMFSDGEYLLRATVDDGTSKKSVVIKNLTIKNLLPTFAFINGEKSFTNKKEYTLSGSVQSSIKTSPRSNIVSVEYSIDNGKNWSPVVFEGGVTNLPELKFSLSLSGLEEKNYDLKFRAKDGRGMYGRGENTLIVIFEPPTPPIISSIRNGGVISNVADEDRNTAGVQITIEGTSKPKTIVNISSAGITSSGLTNSSGKFTVSGVTFKSHGKNTIIATTEDEAGNISKSSELSIVYNNPPIVKFLNPRDGRGLNHKTSIDFSVTDPDGDNITKTVLSYKAPGDKNFRSLDTNPVEDRFEFDVTNFKEGSGYELRLESSDGVSSASKTIQFFVDNTQPEISINPVKEKNFKKDFKFEASGNATDNLSGIEFVEYSLDEEHWFKAIITKGYLSNRANFTIRHPFTLDDGEYEIKFRSVDSAGNQSTFWSEKIYIDTMPPRMGSFEMLINKIAIYPENSFFEVVVGSVFDFKMSLEADTVDASIVLGEEVIPLSQEPASGLWTSKIVFEKIGDFPLKFNAKDQFNNKIDDKIIGDVVVSEKGSVKLFPNTDGTEEPVSGAKITALVFSEDEQKFVAWPANSYGFSNPVETDTEGKYSLFLPSGKFTISIQKPGLVNLTTNEFNIINPRFVSVLFQMKKREGIRGFIEDVLDKFILF